MATKQITVISAAILVIAAAGCCSKKQNPPQHITLNAERGTNVTTVTTNGFTWKIGEVRTNSSAH
jgi:hypothetical protein